MTEYQSNPISENILSAWVNYGTPSIVMYIIHLYVDTLSLTQQNTTRFAQWSAIGLH